MPHKETYRTLLELFILAEKKVKEVGELKHQLTIPSINQLRYVGKHVLTAVLDDDETREAALLIESETHCRRAIYDAMEIGIIYLLERFKLFHMDFKYTVISSVVPDYVDMRKKVNNISEFIGTIPEMDDSCEYEIVKKNSERSQKYFDELKDIMGTLDAAAPELAKKIKRWRIGLIISLSAIAVPTILFVIKYFLDL